VRTTVVFTTLFIGIGGLGFAQPPQVGANGVGDAAAFGPRLVRGGLATAFGLNLATGTAEASTLPLPTSLGGASVTVNNIPAPLIYASPTQINFQIPFEVPAGSTASIVFNTSLGPSQPVQVALADYAIGIFTYARTNVMRDPIVVHGDTNRLVAPGNEAAPGETVVAYATGVKVSNAPRTGAGAPSSPLATAADIPTATLGGAPLRVAFAGLTPGFVGLVQLNLELPATLPSGNFPLLVQFPGDSPTPVNLAVRGNAAAGALSATANSLSFGDVNIGQSRDMTMSIQNTGASPVGVNSLTISGAGFSIVNQPDATILQPGGRLPVTVRFTPAAAGAASGSLTIASTAAGSPAVVTLSGSGLTGGPPPMIDVTPGSLDFGSVTLGQSRDLNVTVRNNGAGALTVSGVAPPNPQFTVLTAVPFAVQPNSSATLSVRFTPATTGATTGNLAITSNDSVRSTVNVALSGAGLAALPPSINVSPAFLDFGGVNPGTVADLSLTVRNTGGGPLTVNSIATTNPRYSIVNPSIPFTVAAGASQTVTVRFSPLAPGVQTGTLTVSSNDTTRSAVNISLGGQGNGSGTAPGIDIDPLNLNFINVAAGSFQDLLLTIRNTGVTQLTVNLITSSNPQFAILNPLTPFNVTPGGFTNVTVRFSTGTGTAATGTLTISSNDPARPTVTVALSGNVTGAGPGVTLINIGQSISGLLSPASARSVLPGSTNRYADNYQFMVPTTQVLTITMNSTTVDAYLLLFSVNGNPIATDDDSGGGTNARITGTFQPGTYRIEATTSFAGQQGTYTLTVAPGP
jgi:uncharacterized protein (TIGR03437 family)